MALLPAASYDVDLVDVVSRGLRMFDLQVAGRRVLLKPNLVEFERGTAINTHPAVVHAAAVAFRSGRRPRGGGGRRARATGATRSTSSRRPACRTRSPTPAYGSSISITTTCGRWRWAAGSPAPAASVCPRPLLAADIVVSMPKLKTHHWAGMTAGMKNLFGVVPGAVYGWPKNVLHLRGIEPSIVDLNATVRVQFTIVDAVVAMEGDGPIRGGARPMGFLAMGTGRGGRGCDLRADHRPRSAEDAVPAGGGAVPGPHRRRSHRAARRIAVTLPDPLRPSSASHLRA